MQGGPHDHITAAKAVAFGEALAPEFREYAKQVISNCQIFSEELSGLGYRVISGGTDNHLIVVDMTSKGISGKDAEAVLDKIGISVSRSTIPNDPNPPMNPSGVRFGTPAITTRGMRSEEMKKIALWINSAIENKDQPEVLERIKEEVKAMCADFPIPSV
jgi:glycine hydroxymethyltransferase